MAKGRAKKGRWVHRKLKLSHHKHTGKRLPNQHTSRGVLVVLMIAAGLMLVVVTRAFMANADAITSEGVLNFSGFIPRPRPTQAATIDQPLNKQFFTNRLVEMKGTCPTFPKEIVVQVIDNGINVGQTPCVGGSYQLQIELLPGTNFVRSKVFDNFGQYGPDSAVIRLIYGTSGSAAGGASGAAAPLSITIDAKSFGFLTGDEYGLDIDIKGGTPPYAINVNWGDEHNDVVSRSEASKFTLTHTFGSGAQYTVLVTASDSKGRTTQTQTTVLVGSVSNPNTPNSGSSSENTMPYVGSALSVLWPAYVVVTGSVVIFWLGELYARAVVSGSASHLFRFHRFRFLKK